MELLYAFWLNLMINGRILVFFKPISALAFRKSSNLLLKTPFLTFKVLIGILRYLYKVVHISKIWDLSFQNLPSNPSEPFANSKKFRFHSSRFGIFFVYITSPKLRFRFVNKLVSFCYVFNMAANNFVIISFKTAHEIFKKLDLAKKRQNDYGTSDFEIVETILHHERVELINFSDQNLDPERLVSSVVNSKSLWFRILNGLTFELAKVVAKFEF